MMNSLQLCRKERLMAGMPPALLPDPCEACQGGECIAGHIDGPKEESPPPRPSVTMPGDVLDVDSGLGLKPRTEVLKFAEEMEGKLRKNDHKTHWRNLPIEALVKLMDIERQELQVALEHFGPAEARNELVDIANFAMMLHDRLGVL